MEWMGGRRGVYSINGDVMGTWHVVVWDTLPIHTQAFLPLVDNCPVWIVFVEMDIREGSSICEKRRSSSMLYFYILNCTVKNACYTPELTIESRTNIGKKFLKIGFIQPLFFNVGYKYILINTKSPSYKRIKSLTILLLLDNS